MSSYQFLGPLGSLNEKEEAVIRVTTKDYIRGAIEDLRIISRNKYYAQPYTKFLTLLNKWHDKLGEAKVAVDWIRLQEEIRQGCKSFLASIEAIENSLPVEERKSVNKVKKVIENAKFKIADKLDFFITQSIRITQSMKKRRYIVDSLGCLITSFTSIQSVGKHAQARDKFVKFLEECQKEVEDTEKPFNWVKLSTKIQKGCEDFLSPIEQTVIKIFKNPNLSGAYLKGEQEFVLEMKKNIYEASKAIKSLTENLGLDNVMQEDTQTKDSQNPLDTIKDFFLEMFEKINKRLSRVSEQNPQRKEGIFGIYASKKKDSKKDAEKIIQPKQERPKKSG